MAGGQALDGTRGSYFWMDPEDLEIVTDPAHHLYDERCKLPVDPAMVRNVMAHTVKQPILVAKDGSRVLVVDGRQRVKAAREANRLFKAEGKEPMKVKALLEKGEEADLFGVTAFANEFRQEDSPLGKAKKAHRLMEFGKSEEEVGVLFGVSKATLRAWLAMLDAAASVRKAVEAGTLAPTAAAELSRLPKEQQDAAVADLQPGQGKVREVRKKIAKAKGRRVKERPSHKVLSTAYQAVQPSDTAMKHVKDVLGWVLGELEMPNFLEGEIADAADEADGDRD